MLEHLQRAARICLGKSPHGPIVGAGASLVNISLGKLTREGQDAVPGVPGRYLDIASDLRARILAGEWAPGTNLPRMADLAREYGVNRDTLARAVAILEAEGLLWAVPRAGPW